MAIVPKLGTTGVLLALALGLCCAAPDIETPRRLALKLTNEELNRIDQQPHDTKVGEEPYVFESQALKKITVKLSFSFILLYANEYNALQNAKDSSLCFEYFLIINVTRLPVAGHN